MSKKIGILGGGQLGRMFLQTAYDYPFEYAVLDPAPDAPCQSMTSHFVIGDFADYDAVIAFGQSCDVIGIEIEHVNTAALAALKAQGKTVIPHPEALTIIKDKGLQKAFYTEHGIKTPPYYLIDDASGIDVDKMPPPFVQKLRQGGYDGKGVQLIQTTADLALLWDAPSVIEAFTEIDKEIAVMVIKDQQGKMAVYPAVEMVFDPDLNLVDYLFAPANLSEKQLETANSLAQSVVQAFDCPGVFAVELFIDTAGTVWVNETAPRVHNSGHHTIEAADCSQFSQMLRVLAGLPVGSSNLRESGAMINLIGAPGYEGEAVIEGLAQLSEFPNTYLHWYGKSMTKPGRKMGHITVLGEQTQVASIIEKIKATVRVISR